MNNINEVVLRGSIWLDDGRQQVNRSFTRALRKWDDECGAGTGSIVLLVGMAAVGAYVASKISVWAKEEAGNLPTSGEWDTTGD